MRQKCVTPCIPCQGCHNKVPQTGCLNNNLVPHSSAGCESDTERDWFLLRAVASGIPCLIDGIHLCLHIVFALYTCLCLNFLLWGHQSYWSRTVSTLRGTKFNPNYNHNHKVKTVLKTEYYVTFLIIQFFYTYNNHNSFKHSQIYMFFVEIITSVEGVLI